MLFRRSLTLLNCLLTALSTVDGEDYVLVVDSFDNISRAKVKVNFIDKINSKVYIVF